MILFGTAILENTLQVPQNTFSYFSTLITKISPLTNGENYRFSLDVLSVKSWPTKLKY